MDSWSAGVGSLKNIGSLKARNVICKQREKIGQYILYILRKKLRQGPSSDMETGRVDRPVGLPVGSRFFDRPVKPVEIPVKFSSLATKRHLSSNQNIHINFLKIKLFRKNSIIKPHLLKTLVEGF